MELLVRINDLDAENFPEHNRRGDVLHVQPDGSEWGRGDRGDAHLRIVRVPGITETEALALLTPEPGDQSRPGHRLHARAFYLDLDALDAEAGGLLLGPRKRHRAAAHSPEALAADPGHHDCEVHAAHVRAAKRRKPRLPSLAVAGG